MKTIRCTILITLIAIFATGYIQSGKAEKGDDVSTEVTLEGLHQYHCSRYKLHIEEVDVNLIFNANLDRTIGVYLDFGTTVSRILCCRNCGNPYSWCDYSEQDSDC